VLSNRSKKTLAKMLNTAIMHGNEAHALVKARAASMAEEAGAEDATVANLYEAEQTSTLLKQALGNLVDVVNDSGNKAAAQDLKSAMRRWRGIHGCLAAERGIASGRRDKRNERTWDIFQEDRALVRERILGLRSVAEELGLDMKRLNKDTSL
jgi:hypothetical protein